MLGRRLKLAIGFKALMSARRRLLCVAASLALANLCAQAGEVTVAPHEFMAATRYTYSSENCWISLVKKSPGSDGGGPRSD